MQSAKQQWHREERRPVSCEGLAHTQRRTPARTGTASEREREREREHVRACVRRVECGARLFVHSHKLLLLILFPRPVGVVWRTAVQRPPFFSFDDTSAPLEIQEVEIRQCVCGVCVCLQWACYSEDGESGRGTLTFVCVCIPVAGESHQRVALGGDGQEIKDSALGVVVVVESLLYAALGVPDSAAAWDYMWSPLQALLLRRASYSLSLSFSSFLVFPFPSLCVCVSSEALWRRMCVFVYLCLCLFVCVCLSLFLVPARSLPPLPVRGSLI